LESIETFSVHASKIKIINKKLLFKSFKTDLFNLKSASNLNDNLNCSKELEHYAS